MRKILFAAALVAVVSSALFADVPVPIAYSNEVKTIRYERVTNYLSKVVSPYTYYVTDTSGVERAVTTNTACFGFQAESTNWPSAIVHSVTYGSGTQALFKVWTCEVLPDPPQEWSNAERRWYNNATWISEP